MARRTLLILVAAIVLGGGIFGIYLFMSSRSKVGQPVNSPEGTAKALIAEMSSNNVDAAYERFSDYLKENYSKDYWKDFFAKFAGYKDQPQQIEATELSNPNHPEALHYPPATSVWRFIYQFKLNNLNYHVTIETSKPNDTSNWKISELSGRYIKE